MKNNFGYIHIWMLFLLLGVGMLGCSEEERTQSLAEPVHLKMTLNSTDLVMGEVLEITFEVTGTDAGSQVMNEDLDIKLTATTDKGSVDRLVFDDFPAVVTMNKGEKTKTIQIPVKKEGINKTRSVEIAAFARGYRVSGALQIVTVGDYHYSKVLLKNNADNTVKEGLTFVLVASVNTTLSDELKIALTPQVGQESRFENFPSELIIPAGSSSVESEPVTIVNDVTTTQDEELTIELATVPSFSRYPLQSTSLKITKIDIHKNMDTKVRDERWLYDDADRLFVSPQNEEAVKAWGQTNYQIMNEGDDHPNSGKVLPEGKWKFFRSYEFHKIPSCLVEKESNDKTFVSKEHPLGFADQNTGAVETAGSVDNAKYSWVTDEGHLRMITLKERTTGINGTKDFGTSAFYSAKFMRGNVNSPTWNSSNIRIYPGMRIETRARLRGMENSGMLPGIWLQGNEQVGGNAQWNSWPDYGEIDVMENNSKHGNLSYRRSVEQTFHIGNLTPGTGGGAHPNPTVAVTDIAGTIDQFQVYWVEWVDNKTIHMGVNGERTITFTEADAIARGGRWPFTDEVNSEGLYYILTMMFLYKQAPNYPPMEMSYLTARSMLKNNPNALIPRMEIDWTRFYIDETYSDHGMPYRSDIILY